MLDSRSTIMVPGREALMQALNGNLAVATALEQTIEQTETTSQSAATSVEATTALQQASVVTLSANATLENERVLQQGDGIEIQADDTYVTIRVKGVPKLIGDYTATLVLTGTTTLVLPASGTVATLSGAEILSQKTMYAPKIAGIGNYADDAAAAAGGVPVTGLYRTGSTLKVRVS